MDSRRKLKKVSKPVHIRVFVTPSCGYCPGVARIAHAIALENSNVSADVIEVEEFPALAQTYQVRGVPKTVITQDSKLGVLPKAQLVGAVSEAEFVDKVLEAGADDEEAT
jgi:thiol-disulfide isomerase/thioredoxin